MRFRSKTLAALAIVPVLGVGITSVSGDVAGATGSGGRSSNKGTSSSVAKGSHIVRSGDSVQSIARRYGVEADDVRAANGIVDDKLYRGARLRIDGSASSGSSSSGASSGPSTSSKSRAAGSTYEVKEGDYLGRIAIKHGVRLSELLAANDMNAASLILPGDDLVIPGASSAGGSSSSSSSTSSSSTSGSSSSAGSVGPDIRCPVPGASFMNDWGFPRDGGDRFHEGTDLFAAKGTTIVAPASGSLAFRNDPRGGKTFTLTTNGGWVIYGAHMSASIGSSRTVATGEAIGRVGSTGNAAGGDPHLHMSVKRSGGSAVNPYPSVRSACR